MTERDSTAMAMQSFRLAYAMTVAKASNQDLAKAVNCAERAVRCVLDGDVPAFDAYQTARAAQFLGCDLHWLSTGEGEPYKQPYKEAPWSFPAGSAVDDPQPPQPTLMRDKMGEYLVIPRSWQAAQDAIGKVKGKD